MTRVHYLDNAATSHPKPDEVLAEVARILASPLGNAGRGSGLAARAAGDVLDGARACLAEFLGVARPERLAFTLNATDGLNLALRSLVRPGGRVVTSAVEHAAVLRPLNRLADEQAVTVTRIATGDDGRVDPDEVAVAAEEGADCVVLTAASNVTGVAQPIAEVARRLAVTATVLVVDAAQAAGSLPLDAAALGPRAVIAFTGHKGLLGPMGAGGLIVGDDIDLDPTREGGTGDSLLRRQPAAMPRRLEAGTLPLPAIAGMAAGVRWLLSVGPGHVRAREEALVERLVTGLAAISGVRLPGFAHGRPSPALAGGRAPLACFLVDGFRPDEVATVLEAEFGVVLRAGLHCAPEAHAVLGTLPDGAVRASVGPTTEAAAVEALLAGVAEVAAS